MNGAPTPIITLRAFLEQLQHEHYKESPSSSSTDADEVLIANLLTSIPSRHQHLLRETGAAFDSFDFLNASVLYLPGGARVILFDSGILSLLISLNKILLSQVDILEFEPTMSLDLAARRAISVVKSFFGDGNIPYFTISSRRMSIASSLSSVQTAFAVGHELSHILLGHLTPATSLSRSSSDRHEMEYAADAHGAELAITSFENACASVQERVDVAMIQAGVDVFFTYYIFIRRISGSLKQGKTHPSIEQRRAQLRARSWDELPEDARSLASFAESLFDSFEPP